MTYYKSISAIRSAEAMNDIETSSYPHLQKKVDREKIFRRHKNTIKKTIERETQKVKSFHDVLKGLIGGR